METSPDFIEREVNRLLDILEKACVRFGVDGTDDRFVRNDNREETNTHGVDGENGKD